MSQPKPIELNAAALLRVLDVARRLAGLRELPEVLKQVIEAGRDVLGADRGTVFLYDKQRGDLYSTVATGIQDGQIRFGIDKGIAGQCAQQRCVINVRDCYTDPRFTAQFDAQTGYRTRSLIAMPLVGLDDELVGVLQLLNPRKPAFDADDERLAEVLASQAAVAIQRSWLMEERLVKLKLEHDLALARKIQLGVLPQALPPSPGYELACHNQPADETGGDIYDVFETHCPKAQTPKPLVLFLADATGHGIGPALSVTQARAMLRVGSRLEAGIDQLIDHINRQLVQDLSSNRFITAFLGVLDFTRHCVDYHAAGQGPLLHYRAANQQCHWHDASTVPLGILEELVLDRPDPIELAPGDVLVLATDGIYEYLNPSHQPFGRSRVGQIVHQQHKQSARQILNILLDELGSFANGAAQCDDVTALIVKRQENA